jgi:hypothetical protein
MNQVRYGCTHDFLVDRSLWTPFLKQQFHHFEATYSFRNLPSMATSILQKDLLEKKSQAT